MEFHFLYRDTTLPEAFLDKYVPGSNILERGFTDTSKHRGGPQGNVRYLIFSSKGRDLTTADENARRWGLVVFEHGMTFRVVDIYKKDAFTQVLLTTESSIPNELIQVARNDLDELYSQPPIAELTTEHWVQRVVTPLGLDDTGTPFPIS